MFTFCELSIITKTCKQTLALLQVKNMEIAISSNFDSQIPILLVDLFLLL